MIKNDIDVLQALFCSQPNKTEFWVKDEERNKKIFIFKKLKLQNLDSFYSKMMKG